MPLGIVSQAFSWLGRSASDRKMAPTSNGNLGYTDTLIHEQGRFLKTLIPRSLELQKK